MNDAYLSRSLIQKLKCSFIFCDQCLSNIREGRKRLTKADFEALAMIGRGAFGEVRLVRKCDTGEVRTVDLRPTKC